ncbi:MAG: DUF6062 family protein [Lachnospiraceae bacterium]|nr:DUF6062 family protein [Lachnospiraceae bacterium]
MKEKLYNIPINDALNEGGECPFCNIERKIEQDMMDFVLGSGSSYMESDVREQTDKAGFCRMHFKKMFDYGNSLGNAWILKTHMMRKCEGLKDAMNKYKATQNGHFAMLKKSNVKGANSISEWVYASDNTCYICNAFKDHYDRYMKTFFEMYTKDKEFAGKVNASKGFCLPHFADIMDYASNNLSEKVQNEFAATFFPVMEGSMDRLFEDVSWFIEMKDYRNANADWKNSKDAIQNCMQKLKGGFPADPVYKARR